MGPGAGRKDLSQHRARAGLGWAGLGASPHRVGSGEVWHGVISRPGLLTVTAGLSLSTEHFGKHLPQPSPGPSKSQEWDTRGVQ